MQSNSADTVKYSCFDPKPSRFHQQQRLKETSGHVWLLTQLPEWPRICSPRGRLNVYKSTCMPLTLPPLMTCSDLASVPALFGALSIHTIVICRKDPIQQQVAENKARQCLLALSVLAKSWPVKIWISRAFVNLLRRLTGQGSASGGSIVKVSSRILNNCTNMASGHSDLPQQRHPSPNGSFPPGNSEPNEQSTQSTRMNIQPRELHVPDYFPHMPDDFICDSFPAGYLDNMLDVDMLLHGNMGPSLSIPFGGFNGAEELDTTGL